MRKILKLAQTDFKLIFRDSSLKAFLVLPIILFVLVVWALPYWVEKYDFLLPYIPVFLVVAVIENTQVFSFISTMVLIDEKETNVAKVFGIVPLTKIEYILSRFFIPYLFTVALNVILFIVQPFYQMPIGVNVCISLLAALVVPVYVLSINSLVQNRMQGMVYVKAFNLLVLVPLVAFFVPESFKNAFGILPTHWVFQSVHQTVLGQPITFILSFGFVFFVLLLFFVSKAFIKKHFV